MVLKQKVARQILDSVEANICLLDEEGNIEEINTFWLKFALENSAQQKDVGIGINYLDVCEKASGDDKELAQEFARGIRDVINGQKESFEMEYPCHSPEVKRWFRGRITPFTDPKAGQMRKVIVFHTDITAQKLIGKRHFTADYFLNNTSDLVAYLDAELNIVWATGLLETQ